MKRQSAILIFAVFLSSISAFTCSWAPGYFRQVTALRGKVVGRNLMSFGPVQDWRWLRQSFSIPKADLILYEYRSIEDMRAGKPEREIARTKSDHNGDFDFGQVAPGHYTLKIVGAGLGDYFDVEITQSAPKTDSIVIDISPVFPDCKGGHEFIVRTKS